MILRAAICLAALALLIGMVVFVAGKIRKQADREKPKQPEKPTGSVAELESVDISSVTHLSFPALVAVPETAFEQEDTKAAESLDKSYLTVGEFNQILQQLYDQNYVLVRMKDLGKSEEVRVPKGKKPLIISQQNVNYEFRLQRQGFASRIIVDENGKITNERVRLDGQTVTGDFDVVSCVETFVEQHPDFSYNGAKGILGLTGYNGILGYRTDALLGTSEGNKYASKYGVFDTEKEIEAVKPVIEALRKNGWDFACNGYDRVSYACNLDQIKEDMEMWKQQVGSIVGDVDILLYPYGTDIGSWGAYRPGEEKYTYLKEQGFRYFAAMDMSGSWNQLTEDYLRCNYRNLDGYRMYQDLYEGAGRFIGLLDFTTVYDQTRPSAWETSEEE